MPLKCGGLGALTGAAEAGDWVVAGGRPSSHTTGSGTAQRVDPLAELRRRRQIDAVHHLGPRVLGELLGEIGRHHGIEADIDHRLGRYASLDRDILRAVGGDRWPAAPIRAMPK